MFGKYNAFVSKARVSACMYFLVAAAASEPEASEQGNRPNPSSLII
jgi:hypothetical protein